MADRFVSVPMTLSDLERPDVMNHFFFRRILITLVRSATSLHCTNASRGLSAELSFLFYSVLCVSFFHFSVLCTYYMCCISCQFSVSVIGKIRTRRTAIAFRGRSSNFAPPLQKTACGAYGPLPERDHILTCVYVFPESIKLKQRATLLL